MTLDALNIAITWPEIFLLVMACVILVVDVFIDDKRRNLTYLLTQLTLLLTAMLITFSELIYSKHSTDYYKCLKLRTNNRLCFSKNKKDFFGHSPVQIGDTEYCLMTDLNSNEIVELVYRILELYNYNRKDITITVM